MSLLLLTALGFAVAPLFLRSEPTRSMTRASGNLREIGLALLDFENEFGSYPDASTVEAVRTKAKRPLPSLGSATSNDIFRQLLASGVMKGEWIFSLGKNSEAGLAKGECRMLYFAGEMGSDPNRPMIAAPVIPGTAKFDRKAMEGRGILVKRDCSVLAFGIDRDGRAIINGMDLFDPRQPFWEGKTPDIKLPE